MVDMTCRMVTVAIHWGSVERENVVVCPTAALLAYVAWVCPMSGEYTLPKAANQYGVNAI